MQDKTLITVQHQTRLKWKILVPVMLLIAVVIIIFSLMSYQNNEKITLNQTKELSQTINYLYKKGISDHAKTLAAAVENIALNPQIIEAMHHEDHQALLELSRKKFARLKEALNITHLYYTGKDRINLLRVHNPTRFGDQINRFTMLEAERTGAPSYGVEIGTLGTFTLRYVYPVFIPRSEGAELIGYIELGTEVEEIFGEIEDMLGVGISVFIEKSILNKDAWEEGMTILGHIPEWDRYPTVVTSAFHKSIIYASVFDHIPHTENMNKMKAHTMPVGEIEISMTSIPLFDIQQRNVGNIVVIQDITDKSNATHHSLIIAISFALLSGVLVCIFFYRYLSIVENRLLNAERELIVQASEDGLTGLLNKRMFLSGLAKEVARSKRHKKQLTLLMIDIDFFKKINDTYGHSTGDDVLKRVSELIQEQCRNIDQAYRFGGEEITVLLPETTLIEGKQVAERIRLRIGKENFSDAQIQAFNITVSIGLATFPTHADSAHALTTHADEALYKAKANGRNQVVASI